MENYFELYDLPVRFNTDASAVKSKYYEFSRRFHPDRFATASDTERTEALRIAALNNDAYKTLTSPDRTMAYILKTNGVLEEEEKYALPPAFLMEMMELNEALSDYEMEPDNESLRQQSEQTLQEQLSTWQEDLEPLLNRFDAGETSAVLLKEIKDRYFRKKYLLRIQERMATFAAR